MGINSSGIAAGYSFGSGNDSYIYNTGGDLFIGNNTAFYQPTVQSQSLYLFANSAGTPNLTITGSRVGIQKSGSLNSSLDVNGSTTITGSLFVSSSIPSYFLGEKVLIGTTTTGSQTVPILNVNGDQYISSRLNIGVNSNSIARINIGNDISGSTTAYGIYIGSNINTGVTTNAIMFGSSPIATSGPLGSITHFSAVKSTFLTSVTNQYGFFADATVTGATNNYGFYGNIASTSSAWNIFMTGSAPNHLAGNTGIGIGKTVPNATLDVSGSTTITGSVQGNVSALTISTNTASINLNLGNFFTLTLSGSTHFTATNIKPGQTVNILLTTNATNNSASFNSTIFRQLSGSAYTPTGVNGAKDILTFISYDATNLYVASVKNLV
jgi:hypothetical protein